MSTSPRSPRMLRGALVSIDLDTSQTLPILFQYNPDTMSRTLQAQTAGDNGDRSEALRLKGAPIEVIKLEVELDATDSLESGDPVATTSGIYPQLSALEVLIYPRSELVVTNTALMAAGTLEVVPGTAPFTLFIWGPQRVLPVRLTEFSITEESYDTLLNPIRARVSLGLRVLNYNDLPATHPGYSLFLAHQKVKETLAIVGAGASAINAVTGGLKLF